MTKDVFDDTNIFKQNYLGDKPTEYDLTVTNKSLTKSFFEPLTKFRFEPQKSKDIKIIGVLAHQQFIKNIEQINLLNVVEQLFITDNTPTNNNTTDGTATNNPSTGNPDSNVAVTGISLSQKTKTMDINTFSELVATLEPANATNQAITWSTDNENVVKVDQQGALASKAVGKAIITATSQDGNFSATTTVTVRSRVQSINVTANENKTLLVGVDTVKVNANVSPTTAEDGSVTWSSSDESIATVDKSGLVTTSSKTGYVDIIATANDGSGVSGKISLEVGAPS